MENAIHSICCHEYLPIKRLLEKWILQLGLHVLWTIQDLKAAASIHMFCRWHITLTGNSMDSSTWKKDMSEPNHIIDCSLWAEWLWVTSGRKNNYIYLLEYISTLAVHHFVYWKLCCRQFRSIAYRQMLRWAHGLVGWHIHKPLPSCVVATIRKAFPSKGGTYKGFMWPVIN